MTTEKVMIEVVDENSVSLNSSIEIIEDEEENIITKLSSSSVVTIEDGCCYENEINDDVIKAAAYGRDVVFDDIKQAQSSSEQQKEEESETSSGNSSFVRKTATAVAGGALVGVGLVMIPLPTPFGCVVASGGMAVLGTEFPAAKRVLGNTCNSVADAIEWSVIGEGGGKNSNKEDEGVEASEKQQQRVLLSLSNNENNSNEKMRNLIKKKIKEDNSNKNQSPKSSLVTDLGKKAVPVIRKLGEGVDKETFDAATASISKAAFAPIETVSRGASQFWRHLMVLNDDEDLMAPFQISSAEPGRKRNINKRINSSGTNSSLSLMEEKEENNNMHSFSGKVFVNDKLIR